MTPDHPTAPAAACSRRAFIGAALVPLVAACAGGDGPAAPTPPAAVEVTTDEIRVRLSRVPALAAVGGSLVVSEAGVIVLHVAPEDFRAFTNVCTHAGCGISQFVAERLRCQCHGSEFDVAGVNVAGPAPLPLARYAVTRDAGGDLVRIARR
jgi:Rieske Fe-S protein